MTSRRSMLKWIPAACVGGWAGLFGKAAAAATAAQPPAAPPPVQPPARDDRTCGPIITHTYYDADGRVIAVYREGPACRPIVTHYEYGIEPVQRCGHNNSGP